MEALSTEQAARDDTNRRKKDLTSQTVNLGEAFNRLGRPQDALNTVRELNSDTTSEYGMAEAGEEKVCAYAQLGNKAKARAETATLLAHPNLDLEAARASLRA